MRLQRLKHAVAFGVYGLGICALSGADILVTKFFSAHDISDWAEVRSLIGLSSILCLVGLDQVLMRSPRSSARILRLLSVQTPLLAIPIGLGIWGLGYLSNWIYAAILVTGSAASLALSQYFRSHHRPTQSQLAQQGWKILAFAAFATMALTGERLPIDPMVTGLVVVTALGAVLLLAFQPPSSLHPQDPESPRALYAIGSRFMVTSLFLASAIYAEQLLVNGVGSVHDGALYFAHATYFLFPISAVNGYFAFLIGPWIRDNHDRFVQAIRTRAWLILLVSIAYAGVMNAVGWLAWQVVAPAVGPVDHMLQGLFLCSCIATTLYTLPSAYNGVFGQPRQHDFLILIQVIAMAGAIGIFLLLYKLIGMSLVHSVAIASALNWGLRTGAGFWVTNIIAASRSSR